MFDSLINKISISIYYAFFRKVCLEVQHNFIGVESPSLWLMISFNLSTSNFKDWIFLSLFVWFASNLTSSLLFLRLASVNLLFLNSRWERPFVAVKYYYHEYQIWDKLRIVEDYCDFWVSGNFHFILLILYIALFLFLLKKIIVPKFSSLNVLPTSNKIKQVTKISKSLSA